MKKNVIFFSFDTWQPDSTREIFNGGSSNKEWSDEEKARIQDRLRRLDYAS